MTWQCDSPTPQHGCARLRCQLPQNRPTIKNMRMCATPLRLPVRDVASNADVRVSITGQLPGAVPFGWSDLFGSLAFSLSFAIIDSTRSISGTQAIEEALSVVKGMSTPTKTPTNFPSFDMTAPPLSTFQRGRSVAMIDMSPPGFGFGLRTTFPATTINFAPDCRSKAKVWNTKD